MELDYGQGKDEVGTPSAEEALGHRPSRDRSVLARADGTNEHWRAQIHKLQYEINSLKQERDATVLRHEEELRRANSKADAVHKRAQYAETSHHATFEKLEKLSQQLQAVQEQSAFEKNELEGKLRSSYEEARGLREEVEDLRVEQASQERQSVHDLNELGAKYEALQRTTEEIREDRDNKASALAGTQQQLMKQESEKSDLEVELSSLKVASVDATASQTIKKELSDQTAHIRKLEATNLDQSIELERFRKQQKAIEVVEEEKRLLEGRARIIDDLRRELSEAQLQKQILEDEKKSWSSYLDNEASADSNEHQTMRSPEDLVRAYAKVRSENASLVDRLGQLSPELAAKDVAIQVLEEKQAKLVGQLGNLQLSRDGTDGKAMARLERQRTLAVKEVDYLRAQLKAVEAEESEFNDANHDQQKVTQIHELEDVIDKYRKEVQTLNSELKQKEVDAPTSGSPINDLKRGHETQGNERLGELSRKNRSLQEDLANLSTQKSILTKELDACKAQLSSLQSTSRIRILELRRNPTADAEAVKQSTLETLRTENDALLSQLQMPSNSPDATGNEKKTVPVVSLARAKTELAARDDAIASKDKHILRLKQIFASKSAEFREAVASILGWKFDFMPNGRVRVTSMLYPGEQDEDGEGTNSIVFDGDKGTMKVSGGPQSAFANEIRSLIEFWVEGRKEIPCFLAACTLEFFEKTTRAQK